MNLEAVSPVVQKQFLRVRKILQLDDAEGTVIAVDTGSLWVTMESDSRDIVLAPGTRFEVDRAGRTIIAAEADSRFALMAPENRTHGIAAWVSKKLAAWRTRRARWQPFEWADR